MFGYLIFSAILMLAKGQVNSKVVTEGFELKYVQVIMRSPEHSPSEIFFNLSSELKINLKVEDFKTQGYDQIYPKGKKRMHNIGKSLKKRYSSFLTQKTDVEVLSYDYLPGKHGILITEAGLKGTPYNDVKDKHYTYEELAAPFKTDLINDIIYPFDHIKCPAYEEEIIKIEEQDKKLLEQYKEQLTGIDKIFGGYQNVQSYFFLHAMYQMHTDAGNQMPKWFRQNQKVMKDLLGKFLGVDVSSLKLKQLNGGRYTSHILQEIENIKTGTSCPKMVLLCVSPHMLRALIESLGGEKGFRRISTTLVEKFPEYGAMFVIEVYKKKDRGTYHVRFLYKNLQDKYHKIIMEGCSELCGLSKFKTLLGTVPLPLYDLKEMCEAVDKKKTSKKPK